MARTSWSCLRIAVQEQDRGRFDAEPLRASGRSAAISGLVERRVDLAVGEHALVDLEAQRPLDQRLVLLEEQIVGIRPVDAADLVDVAKAFGDQQRGPGARALEDGVDRDGRAVQEQPGRSGSSLPAFVDPGVDAFDQPLRRRQRLAERSLPVRSSNTAMSVKVPPMSAARRTPEPWDTVAVLGAILCSWLGRSRPAKPRDAMVVEAGLSAAHGEAMLDREVETNACAAGERGGRMKLHADALRGNGNNAFEHVAEVDQRFDPTADLVAAVAAVAAVVARCIGRERDVLRPHRQRHLIADLRIRIDKAVENADQRRDADPPAGPGAEGRDLAEENIGRADEVGDETASRAAGRSRRGLPICTIRPSLITAIASDRTSASAWSCVTKTVVMPRLAAAGAARSASPRAARVEVATAARRAAAPSARGTSARASARRCCWPPLSIGAGRSASSPSRTSSRHCMTRSRDLGAGRLAPPVAQREHDVLEHRHVRPDRVGLEHHAERGRAAGRDTSPCAEEKSRRAVDRDLAASGAPGRRRSAAGSSCRSRTAPAALELAALQLEAHALEGVKLFGP